MGNDGNAKTPGRRGAKKTNTTADSMLPFGLPRVPAALRLCVKMKSHIRQSAEGDDRRFNPPEQPAVGVKRSHKDANHPARNGLFRWRYKIEFSSLALDNDQTSDDASGVSLAPIDALLFEARLNGAVKLCGFTMWYKPSPFDP